MFGAVLLAAGESTRMGTLKALLSWGDSTLIEYQLAELAASSFAETVVVLGYAAEQLEPIVRRAGARAVVNQRYRDGRSTSIRAGIRALSQGIEGAAILNVDQPRPRAILDTLVATHARANALISRPAYRGKHGHPPIFSRRLFGDLMSLSETSEGLKGLVRRHGTDIQDVTFDDPIVLLNLNDPAAYEAALPFQPPGSNRRPPGPID